MMWTIARIIYLFLISSNFIWLGIFVQGSPAVTTEVSGLSKEKVILPCQLSQETCGPIHSIKWHRGFRRVYIFSEIGATSKAEDDLIGRAELHLETNKSLALLEIDPLMTADEDLYKCEVTYLEAKEHCALLQYIRLNTFAKPESLRIETLAGDEKANTSLIGPFNEGSIITLVCISKGGKPVSKLEWFNSSTPLQGQYNNITEHDGTGIATSQLQIELSRGDLGAKLECRASSQIMSAPSVSLVWVEVDVRVRPNSWEVTGHDAPVLEGTMITLLCQARGSRPPSNLTWYNGTRLLTPHPNSNLAVQSSESEESYAIDEEMIEADGTYETQSRLSFTATRYDNGIVLDCQISNLVMESMQELPYRALTKIQVNYKPVVNISPLETTVNETTNVFLVCDVDANPPELVSVRWYQDGQLLDVSDISHYQGGTTLEPSLLIKNSSREDLGNYTCVVQNAIGETMSEIKAVVNIQYKASVVVSMDPPTPVIEQDERNVTLSCDLVSGNPEELDAVQWYLEGDLLKELPDCPNATNDGNSLLYGELCDIDPTKLMLQNVGRSFEGNYQCKARNAAGWGEMSPSTKLHVHYPPGQARIDFDPHISSFVKGQALNLRCVVDEPGRPPAKVFRWMRGAHVQIDQTSANLTIFPVSLEHRANFSCEAINEAGHGPAGNLTVDVFVPPTFITPLMPYHGVPWNATEVKITCQVECYPLCEIYWLKNGLPISYESKYFTIKNTKLPPEPDKNDFESVVSTLSWNMTALPNGKLNRAVDNDNYTCQSTGNDHGSGVSSTTHFRVEYPPEKINVSSRVINVDENEYPEEITCVANALPEATYTWKYGNEIVSEKSVLFLNYTLKRDHGGDYECIARNPHGEISTKATINVLFAPECEITSEFHEDERILVCTVKANPGEVDFQWWLGNATYSKPETISQKRLRSELRLLPQPEFYGTYRCIANNSVGLSNSCELIISGNWVKKLTDYTLIIIIVVILLIILVIGVPICIFLILMCRRKRMGEKNHSTRPEERQNPDGRAYISTYDASPPLTTNFTTNSYTHFTEIVIPTNRKRKKPTRDPSPAHRKVDLPEDGKAFYENLPFHGLQSPQSKLNLVNMAPETATSTELRPPSELSQTQSSGYGSTRSQTDMKLFASEIQNDSSSTTVTVVDCNGLKSHKPQPLSSNVVNSFSETGTPEAIGPKTSTPIPLLNLNKVPLPIPPSVSNTDDINTTTNNRKTVNIKLATVRPQRISSFSNNTTNSSSFGTLRPLRMPEAPKVFFRSFRGKSPTNQQINHFHPWNSIRIEKDTTKDLTNNNHSKPNPLLTIEVSNPKPTSLIKPKSISTSSNKSSPKKRIAQTSKIPCSKDRRTANKSNILPCTDNSTTNDKNNNNNDKNDLEDWKPVPHPAPRVQTLKKSKRHTYQNIPFTRKTPRCEPYRPTTMDLEYADKDYRQFYSYGPMNYKAASAEAVKENNNWNPGTGSSSTTAPTKPRRITSIFTPAVESEML